MAPAWELSLSEGPGGFWKARPQVPVDVPPPGHLRGCAGSGGSRGLPLAPGGADSCGLPSLRSPARSRARPLAPHPRGRIPTVPFLAPTRPLQRSHVVSPETRVSLVAPDALRAPGSSPALGLGLRGPCGERVSGSESRPAPHSVLCPVCCSTCSSTWRAERGCWGDARSPGAGSHTCPGAAPRWLAGPGGTPRSPLCTGPFAFGLLWKL